MLNTVLILFFEFFKIGLFAIGGGPATIPFLMDLAKNRPWFNMEELTNMIAISESTPGPVGLNMATYAGYSTVGLFGGVISTLGLVIPSIIVIIIIAKFMDGFSENRYVKAAFSGIRPVVVSLIAAAELNLFKVSLFKLSDNGTTSPLIVPIILAIIIFTLLRFKKFNKLHPALWFLFGAVAGLIFHI